MEDRNLDSLFGGESELIEYKVARPKDAKKYLKTVVAFSNSHGGSIVFGVDDRTHEVVGIPSDEVPGEMDAIANAIADACTPTIIPSIYVCEAEGKSLIVVDVAAGRQVPYYLKTLGLEHGVYTRIGATSRPADFDYAREIMIENSPRGFDRMPNREVRLTDEGIEALCARMYEVALKHSRNAAERDAVKRVTKNQLLKWGVLLEREGELLPTNAYALLTGEGTDFSWRMQCGVFRGTGRSVFLDRREFDGGVIDQVEEAYQYALSKINLGANFDDLVRRDEYEIPMWPIRELITNAILHRSYLIGSCVQVCLYDDRLEISSPGGLKRGLTLEKALAGRSEIRNHALAQSFYYMKLIENWGTGLRRARDQIVDFGLREPEFVVDDDFFRVNIYRMSLAEFGEKLHPSSGEMHGVRPTRKSSNVNALDNKSDNKDNSDNKSDNKDNSDNKSDYENASYATAILGILASEPDITQVELAKRLGIARSTLAARLSELRSRGLVRRVGARKNGRWEVSDGDDV